MSLCWAKCRLIFCLFLRDSITFSEYLESTLLATFYITNELVTRQLYPRWKIRVYLDKIVYNDANYVSIFRMMHKCDAEIICMELPFERTNPYWFTSMRFILPSLDTTLSAFRLLDVHYSWTKLDIRNIVTTIQNWEESNKRCCLWKYSQANQLRPYCLAIFGLNLSKDSADSKLRIDYDFLLTMLKSYFPRIKHDLSGIQYGDDEWLLYLLVYSYFYDKSRMVDTNRVYLVKGNEKQYICIRKRYSVSDPQKAATRLLKVTKFIESNQSPHKVTNEEKIQYLYQV
jgi:hypothetical protein